VSGQLHACAAIPPGKEPLCADWIGGWLGTRTYLDYVDGRKSHPYRNSNSDPRAVQPVASLYADCSIPAPRIVFKRQKKTIPLRGLGGPYDCETSRLPHFLYSRFLDYGEFVSLTRWPPFTPQEDSWYSFLLEATSSPGHSAAGRIRPNLINQLRHREIEPATFRLVA
jgi:hypothetical protein